MTSDFNIRMPSEADLARYREASLREVMAANRPRLLEVVKAIQPAALKAIDAEEK